MIYHHCQDAQSLWKHGKGPHRVRGAAVKGQRHKNARRRRVQHIAQVKSQSPPWFKLGMAYGLGKDHSF